MSSEGNVNVKDSYPINSNCQICDGTKRTFDNRPCFFCNETGISNNFANAFIKNHICLCSISDRKNCPICRKKCHHDSTLKPQILVSPYH